MEIMNDTKNTTLPIDDKSELVLAVPKSKTKRHSPGEFDESYIKAYLDAPQLGKSAAYRLATGDNGPCYRQRANTLHLRLQREINERLKDKVLGSIGYGLNVLFDLAENSKSENIRAAVASKLVDFGLKFTPPDSMKERPIKTREELEADITATQERIKLARRGVVT